MLFNRTNGSRRGQQVAFLTGGFTFLAFLCGIMQAQRADSMVRYAQRMVEDRTALDAAESALAEATFEFMSAVNKPGAAVFKDARTTSAKDVLYTSGLTRTRALFVDTRKVQSVQAWVGIVNRKTIRSDLPEGTEYSGQLLVAANVVVSGSPRRGARALQYRQLKAVCTAPPPPLDRYDTHDWRVKADGHIAVEFEMVRSYWAKKATLLVRAGDGKTVQQRYDALAQQLGAVNGIIYVDNAATEKLVLSDVTFKGKAVLVTRGPLELRDVKLDDPTRDALTVIAFGDVRLGGAVEAAVILTGSADDPKPSRTVEAGTSIKGSFIVTCGTYDGAGDLRLTWTPKNLVSSPRAGAAPYPDRIHVAVSPTLSGSRTELVAP